MTQRKINNEEILNAQSTFELYATDKTPEVFVLFFFPHCNFVEQSVVFVLMPRRLMWATAPIKSPCDSSEIQNPYGGLTVLQLTCIVWPTGYRVVA